MRCPYCHGDSRVVDSRANLDVNSVRRRRECLECEKRFTTYEKIEESPLVVRKKDGSTELFNRQKVLKGLVKACEKRPISVSELEEVALDIERSLRSLGREISSKEIGETIMDRLLTIDEVAYVRFASVYKDFGDLDTFIKEIEGMRHGQRD